MIIINWKKNQLTHWIQIPDKLSLEKKPKINKKKKN